ncbi:hypothetical protein, partial [Micromonospora orduensis]|uniref:hypothetical protein n=1 Tax=Micromonospora orduensis TaxID=1420891 RepID=UPI003403FC04
MPGAESAGSQIGKAPERVPLCVVFGSVCGCSLRTQQGACKASANYDLYPGLVRFFSGWLGFLWQHLFVAGTAVPQFFVGEFDPGSG